MCFFFANIAISLFLIRLILLIFISYCFILDRIGSIDLYRSSTIRLCIRSLNVYDRYRSCQRNCSLLFHRIGMSHISNKLYLPIHLSRSVRRPSRLHFYVSLTCIPRCTSVLLFPLCSCLTAAPTVDVRDDRPLLSLFPSIPLLYACFTPSIFELVEKPQWQRDIHVRRHPCSAHARPDRWYRQKKCKTNLRRLSLFLFILVLTLIINYPSLIIAGWSEYFVFYKTKKNVIENYLKCVWLISLLRYFI